MGQVAGMELPCAIGQLAQHGETVDDGARVGGQRGGNLGGFSGALAQEAACKKRAGGKNKQAGKTNETQRRSGIHRGEILPVIVSHGS